MEEVALFVALLLSLAFNVALLRWWMKEQQENSLMRAEKERKAREET